MERNQQQNRFRPRNERYHNHPQKKRPPITLEPTNIVDHESPPFCQGFCEETTCATYLEMINNEANNQDSNNYLDTCNKLIEGRKAYPLSHENMKQVKNKGIDFEKAIRIFGERPSQEEIKRMWANRHKGIIYQRRKGNAPQVDRQSPVGFPKKSNQPIESSTRKPQEEHSISASPYMEFDITNRVSDVKVLAPLTELAKLPSVTTS